MSRAEVASRSGFVGEHTEMHQGASIAGVVIIREREAMGFVQCWETAAHLLMLRFFTAQTSIFAQDQHPLRLPFGDE